MSGRVGTCVVAEVEVDLGTGTNRRDEWPGWDMCSSGGGGRSGDKHTE